jgi:hypothetical protein
MSIRNTQQQVNAEKYGEGYDRIFGRRRRSSMPLVDPLAEMSFAPMRNELANLQDATAQPALTAPLDGGS